MKTLLFLALFFVSSAHASTEFVCSIIQAQKIYKELQRQNINDKTKHCVLSCHMALRCPSYEVWNLGVLKEIYDLFGDGNAEWADLEADRDGIVIAVSRRARTTAECYRECREIYP
jgi:hypothetical protein